MSGESNAERAERDRFDEQAAGRKETVTEGEARIPVSEERLNVEKRPARHCFSPARINRWAKRLKNRV